MNQASWQDEFAGVMMRSYPMPLRQFVRGEGVHVWDADGNEYLDFLAGIAVNALGHAHPVFVEAVSRQAATLAHVSNYFSTPPQLELAQRLRRLAAAADGRVYFGNSGAEAIEAAIKLARRTGRTEIIALQNAFHGRTMGSLSLTGKPVLRDPFEPLLPGVRHIPATADALETAIGSQTAAVVLEPIQGEAGVIDLPDGFLERARELTTAHGALLILDEIQTGAGRTGEWFAFQHTGVVPDAIAVAKGIGGGFPIGALVTFASASDLLAAGHHGSTFGGNALATATANAVLAEIERAGLVRNAAGRGEQLRAALRELPHVTEVRGRGLLLGVGLDAPIAHAVNARALELGLIVNAANDTTIRLAPPLIIGDDEVSVFAERFAQTLSTIPSEAPA